MTIKSENHRFVVILEKDIFNQFKTLAQKEKRSASNLAAKIISDFVQQNKEY